MPLWAQAAPLEPGRLGRARRREALGRGEGAKIAEDGGLTVLMDRCIRVEHARYEGRTHWLGFNTQRITSVRTGLQ